MLGLSVIYLDMCFIARFLLASLIFMTCLAKHGGVQSLVFDIWWVAKQGVGLNTAKDIWATVFVFMES